MDVHDLIESRSTDSELDAIYTRLCKTMTQIGENNAFWFACDRGNVRRGLFRASSRSMV